MREDLFQKTGLIVSRLAQDLLCKKVGDRLDSISEYEKTYGASRGTIQNALQFLKENNVVRFRNRGHMGTYIEEINYVLLQQYSPKNNLVGIMPLPYSKLYEGLASALYLKFKDRSLNFNLAYVRGAESRIELVVNKVHDFAVCSKHAALQAKKVAFPIEVTLEFGKGSYLSEHVLVFGNKGHKSISSGMRVGVDKNSYDQRDLTEMVVGDKEVEYVDIRSHQIIQSIQEGKIDVGVWNLDEILEKKYQDIYVVSIEHPHIDEFSEAVIVIREDAKSVGALLERYINVDEVKTIQKEVKDGTRIPSY